MFCMKIDREEEFADEATTSVRGIAEAIERSSATGDHFHIQQILRYKSINLSKYWNIEIIISMQVNSPLTDKNKVKNP